MAQSSLFVVTPAEETALVTLYEAKISLGLAASNDEATNDLVELSIDWASAEIAALANRVFAKETVTEVFRGVEGSNRIFLSRYPVTNIESIDEDGDSLVEDDGFELDANSGTLVRLNGAWFGPVTVTYTGGYDLPIDSPKALRRASLLMTREAYYAATRGDASIRMIGHRDARVIYFDPNAKSSGGASSGGSATMRSVGDLLKHFMRFEVYKMTFSVSTGVLGQLIGSLLQGADNTIEKLILEKVDSFGKDMIADLIRSTPLGAGLAASKRYQNFIGMSDREFKAERESWLNTLLPTSESGTAVGLPNKIMKAFTDAIAKEQSEQSPEKRGHWKWSKSRNEWLDEGWRHDWRSQPRNVIGRWVEGRLNYIYVGRGRASKKVRSARRRFARKIVKWNAKTGIYE